MASADLLLAARERGASSLHPRLVGRLRPGRGDLAASAALGVSGAVLLVLQGHLLSQAVSRVFLGRASLAEVGGLLLGFLALSLARAGCAWAAEAVAQRAASRVKTELRGGLTRSLLDRGPLPLGGERTGELANTLVAGVESLDPYLRLYLPQLLLAVLVPSVLLAAILPVDPISGLVFLVSAPLAPLFMSLIGGFARARARRLWTSLSRMSAQFLDLLQGLTTLRLLGRSRAQADVIAETSEGFRRASLEVLKVALLSAAVLELTATLGTALVAVQVGLRLLYGRLPFDEALFVLILAPEFFRPLRSLGAAHHSAIPGAEAAGRIATLLDPPRPSAPVARRPAPEGPFDLKLIDVRFSYQESEPVLDGVSFSIAAGQQVALVGPNGAGKSTIAHLLLRFAEPGGGSILVQGTPLAAIDPDLWRRRVAWIPQRPHLFHGTVAENIRLARPEATDEQVEHAARLAQAEEFIRRLPRGFDTPLGQDGARLSGGEAQRIALARAFLRDAPLLILDEATSQLDPESEVLIGEALRRMGGGRTVLWIGHHLPAVRGADTVVLLASGRVVEQGSHAELVERGRLYVRLLASLGGAG